MSSNFNPFIIKYPKIASLSSSLSQTLEWSKQNPMASLSTTTTTPPFPPPPPPTTRRPASFRTHVSTRAEPDPNPPSPSSSSSIEKPPRNTALAVSDERTRRILKEVEKQRAKEAKERKELVNRKIASQKAISVILRREATKAIIDKRKKKGPTNSKKLLPRTVLEALHERITALRWESALKAKMHSTDIWQLGN